MSSLCKSCDAELSGIYCSECGQKLIKKRLTVPSILALAYQKVFDLENSFWTTIRMLISAPHKVVFGYLDGATKKYYNPVRFVFIAIALSLIVISFFGFYDAQMEGFSNPESLNSLNENQKAFQETYFEWLQKSMNFVALFVIPFFGLASFLLYRKKQLHYAEHLAINCYGMGMATLLGIPLSIIAGLFGDIMILGTSLSIGASIIYYTYFLEKLWTQGYAISSLKSLLLNIFGYLTYLISFVLIGGLLVGLILSLKS